MASLESFFPLIQPSFPDCPRSVLKTAVRESCIEFCRRTRLLTNSVTVSVKAGKRLYDLYPIDGEAWEVLDVRRDGISLNESNRDEFIAEKMDENTDTPTDYYIEPNGQLVLGPVPTASETLTAKVTAYPDRESDDVPDALYSQNLIPIAAGARAYIYQINPIWLDEKKLAYDRVLFEDAIADVQLQIAKGRSRKPLRSKARFF